MTYPTIQRYPPSGGSALGADTQSRAALSADGAALYTMCAGTASDSGLRSYNVSTSAQIVEATLAAIYGGANDIASPYCMTPTGQLFVTAKGWSNGSAQLSIVDPATLALIDTWNSADVGGSIPSLPYAPGAPQTFGATSKQGVSYVACCEAFSLGSGGAINVMQAGATGGGSCQFAGHSFNIDEAQGVCCGSPADTGKMFTLGRGPNSADSADFGLYVTSVGNGAANYDVTAWPGVPNGSISTTKIGTIAVTDIDATWSTTLGCTAPGYDKSDGNILAFFQTNDVVTDTVYLCKIQVSDATILWARSMGALNINEIYNAMPASDIDGGVFKFFGPSDQRLWIIDTTDGSIISNTHLSGLFGGLSNTCSIDSYATNSVFIFGAWSDATTPPYPVGGITPSATTYWYRLQAGDAPTPTPPAVVTGVPVVIGCAYTSRAQLLRPDFGNDAGSQAGPAFAKLRRIHQYGAYLFRTRNITFGTSFDAGRQHAANLYTGDNPETEIGLTELLTGIISTTLDDPYSWTAQIAWEQTRPTPGTILAISGYIETSEK